MTVDLAGNHHVGRALDAVDQRVAAAVEIVELRLGDRVVHVEGRDEQLALLLQLVEAMHAGRGFFRNAAPFLHDLVKDIRVLGVDALEQVLDHRLLVGTGWRVHPVAAFFELVAFVQEKRHVAAVVHDELRAFAVWVTDRVPGAIPILLERLAFPGKDRHASFSDGRGGVILGGENVAGRPAHVGTEGDQRLDQHRRLDRHVQRAGDAHAGQRLARCVLFPDRHQAGHFLLGDRDFLAAPVGEGDVGDLVVGGLGSNVVVLISLGCANVCYRAACLSASALSVRSQVRSASSLPKWP